MMQLSQVQLAHIVSSPVRPSIYNRQGATHHLKRPRNRFESSFFNCGRKGHRAEERRSAEKIEKL